MTANEHALVVGGAGFVGSHLVDRLLARGAAVTVIDSLLTGSSFNLDDAYGHPNFRGLRVLDVTDTGRFTDALTLLAMGKARPLTTIYFLASPASPEAYTRWPLQTLRVNSVGLDAALTAAERWGLRLVFTSTSEVYGDPLVHPQPESYFGNVDPTGPRAMYDEAKRYGEALCSVFAREGVDVGIARIFNCYGPRLDPNDGRAVPQFLKQAFADQPLTVHGTGEQTRTLVYVEDLVDGLIALGERRGYLGPVNLGRADGELSMTALAEACWAAVQEARGLVPTAAPLQFVPAREQDPQQRKPVTVEAETALGWTATTTLREGLRKTARWYASSIHAEGVPA